MAKQEDFWVRLAHTAASLGAWYCSVVLIYNPPKILKTALFGDLDLHDLALACVDSQRSILKAVLDEAMQYGQVSDMNVRLLRIRGALALYPKDIVNNIFISSSLALSGAFLSRWLMFGSLLCLKEQAASLGQRHNNRALQKLIIVAGASSIIPILFVRRSGR